MKISLVDFYMPNNFYNVELKNSFARITVNAPAVVGGSNNPQSYTIIERGNYYDVQDVATNFALTVANIIRTLVVACGTVHKITNNSLKTQTTPLVSGGGGVDPATPVGQGRPDKKLLDVTIEFQNAHTITSLLISCLTTTGESYLLLGGERNDNTGTSGLTHNSFLIDLTTDPKQINIRGYFPMQLTSEPHVYLRTTLGQNGLESAILARDDTNYNSEIIGSDILAKIPRNLESFTYEANGNTEDFFIYYQQRKLNQIRLYLTDSKGRPIGRPGVADTLTVFGSGTAAGLESTPPSIPPLSTDRTTFVKATQNTQGNMYFTSTLKIQIIKKSSPTLLETPMIPLPPFPSKASGVVSFGDKYGKT
jgi:hypothetical protein